MANDTPRKPAGRIAENGARWPDLQWLLAPAAGCDCQMMALAMTDDEGAATKATVDLKVTRR